MIIIGMQKKSLFEVWQFEVTQTPGLIEQGRKKYERLLKAFGQLPARPTRATVNTHPRNCQHLPAADRQQLLNGNSAILTCFQPHNNPRKSP